MTQTAFERSVAMDEPAKRYLCTRCGIEMNAESSYRRILRGADATSLECGDCRSLRSEASKSYLPNGCRPWQGELDLDTFAPINEDGSLHMPGERTCGNADCVNSKHVPSYVKPEPVKKVSEPKVRIPVIKPIKPIKPVAYKAPKWEKLIAERYQITYRTGVQRSYRELLKALRAEGQA